MDRHRDVILEGTWICLVWSRSRSRGSIDPEPVSSSFLLLVDAFMLMYKGLTQIHVRHSLSIKHVPAVSKTNSSSVMQQHPLWCPWQQDSMLHYVSVEDSCTEMWTQSSDSLTGQLCGVILI